MSKKLSPPGGRGDRRRRKEGQIQALRERGGGQETGRTAGERGQRTEESHSVQPPSVLHRYRKIQGLEWDPVIREYMQSALFKAVGGRMYGEQAAVGVYRTMFFNKPAVSRAKSPFPLHPSSACVPPDASCTASATSCLCLCLCLQLQMTAPPQISGGSELAWHQDRWSTLDRDPAITVYLALDEVADRCAAAAGRRRRRRRHRCCRRQSQL